MMLCRRRICVDRLAVASGVTVLILLLVTFPSFSGYRNRGDISQLADESPARPSHENLHFKTRRSTGSEKIPRYESDIDEELDESEVKSLLRQIEGERRANDFGIVRFHENMDVDADPQTKEPEVAVFNRIKQERSDANWKSNDHETVRSAPPNLDNEVVREMEKPAATTHTPSFDLTFWSMDYDISNIFDLKMFFKTRGVRVIDKSLSARCSRTKTCAADLRVVNATNGLSLPSHLIGEFYREYKNDQEMDNVDGFICINPMSMCELFEPFNKPMILIAQDRYENGRQNAARWQHWNAKLKSYAKDPQHVIAATSQYDATYIHYFTGLVPLLLPQHCGYVHKFYSPKYTTFLLGPIRNVAFKYHVMKTFRTYNAKEYNVTLIPVEDIYKPYKLSHIVSHRAMVFIPSRVSQVRLTEIYRTNTPLFVPSLDLLVRWQQEYHIVKRKLPVRSKHAGAGSAIDGVLNMPDPNDDRNVASLRFWLKLSDVYSWPHITYFSSLDSLGRMLANTTPRWLKTISTKMARQNHKTKAALEHTWDKLLQNIETN